MCPGCAPWALGEACQGLADQLLSLPGVAPGYGLCPDAQANAASPHNKALVCGFI